MFKSIISKAVISIVIGGILCQTGFAIELAANQTTPNLQLRKNFWGHEFNQSSSPDKWLGIGWRGGELKSVLQSNDKAMSNFAEYEKWNWIDNLLIFGGFAYFYGTYQPSSTRINSSFQVETTEAKYNFTGLAIALIGGLLRNFIEIPALENSVKAYNNK